MIDPSNYILPNPHFEASILYLLPEDGGRSKEIFSGYRGQFYYDGKNWDAGQQFIDKQLCEPGDTVKVLMQTASPSIHAQKLFVNKRFEIREGIKVVGVGKISKILLEELEKKTQNSYEVRIVDLIIRNNPFGIKAITNLDGVKSTYFKQSDYLAISELIKQKKWYAIDNNTENTSKDDFYEYIYVEVFSDQNGAEYAATIYDNDELWQDPQVIDIFPLS